MDLFHPRNFKKQKKNDIGQVLKFFYCFFLNKKFLISFFSIIIAESRLYQRSGLINPLYNIQLA